MKRFLAIVLTICLLAAALPVSASAQVTQHKTLIRQINRCYSRTCAALNTSSLDNMCGTFVGYQLYYLGVTSGLVTCNGSQFYDVYSRQKVTSGGYNIDLYPARNFTLEQSLNAITHNGTKDAYNIMLCFNWTKSGGSVGHVMLIHAIIDGIVYAVDNFETYIAGREGNPIVAPIGMFADEYDGWSVFEGAVSFGVKEYASQCANYATDLFVKATQQAELVSQPAPVGSNGSELVRAVAAGERLYVTEVVVGQDDVNYYRVCEGGMYHYIQCAQALPIRVNTEGVQANVSFSNVLEVGQKGTLSGEILSTGSLIGRVELKVTDSEGEEVFRNAHYEARFNHDLDRLDVDLSKLPQGVYDVKLYVSLWNYYDEDGVVRNYSQRLCLYEDVLTVGDVQDQEPKTVIAFAPVVKHSWLYEDGAWHCYQNGEPRTGWYCYDGVDYYLQEDGSVTTGWANINGEDRFFSDTGAMRTGWLEENGDIRYMLFNGVSAKGWREIDGVNYYFDDNGILDEDKIPKE